MSHFQQIQTQVAGTSRDHGFWDVDVTGNPASLDRKLMLIVGEIGEAHEEWRTHGLHSYSTIDMFGEKPCGFLSELADAVIRIMDLCEQLGMSLENAILAKDAYNQNRPVLHGKRF